MRYLLDTDWIIDYLSGRQDAIDLVSSLLPTGVGISAITFMEIMEGIYTSRDPIATEQVFKRFLEGVAVVDVTRVVAERAAWIRGRLRQQGRPLTHRALDILIAATALTHNLDLVTRNSRDYEDIPDLSVYAPA